MTSPALQPETIQRLANAPYLTFAMIAGMQLELFTPLGAGPMHAEQLAAALGVSAAKLTPLLYVLVAAGLLTLDEGRFTNTPEADTFFVRGKPTYLGDLHANYTTLYHAALQTAASIRTGQPQAKLDFAAMSSDALETYLRGLYPATLASGRLLLSRYDFTAHRHLLDVGGGSGGLACTIVAACPQLRATVIDLPSVAPVTQRFVAQEGMTERVAVVTGDVVRGPLSGTYDVAVLRALIQVLSPAEAQRVFHHLSQVLEPGSPIFILGNVLDNTHLAPPETVALSLVFLNTYDEGHAYTEHEYRTWLVAAGFTGIERVPLTGGSSLISARKALAVEPSGKV